MPLRRKILSASVPRVPLFTIFQAMLSDRIFLSISTFTWHDLLLVNLNQDQSFYISPAYFIILGDKNRTFLWIEDTYIYHR